MWHDSPTPSSFNEWGSMDVLMLLRSYLIHQFCSSVKSPPSVKPLAGCCSLSPVSQVKSQGHWQLASQCGPLELVSQRVSSGQLCWCLSDSLIWEQSQSEHFQQLENEAAHPHPLWYSVGTLQHFQINWIHFSCGPRCLSPTKRLTESVYTVSKSKTEHVQHEQNTAISFST